MKKLVLFFATIFIGLVVTTASFAEEPLIKDENDQHTEKENKYKYHHRLIDKEKLEELTDKGFSKKDIFMGAMLGKKANKSVDEVLDLYKEKESWEDTATELGISLEEFQKIDSLQKWSQFMKENKEEIIAHLAVYSNKEVSDIQAHMDDKIPLRFLIGASAMAKLSNKDLDEIISLKKEGKNFHEIMKTIEIDPEDLHKELSNFKKEVEEKIEGEKTEGN